MLKKLIYQLLFLHFLQNSILSQFIKIQNLDFIKDNLPFYVCGFNAYYLHSEAAKGKLYIVDETFQFAKNFGFNVVRCWAFYESENINNKYAIRTEPYRFNDNSLLALDYVLAKAKEYDIALILTLANHYDDFGGISAYLKWAKKNFNNNNLTKKDFYSNDTIKKWYKFYVDFILNRINFFTGVKYKDDPTIFSFELINEAENIGENFLTIRDWYSEMAKYFKSIDTNHLLSTGETGYDVSFQYYYDYNFFYNSRSFLFDGTKGTSYIENLKIKEIDYACAHLYPDGWGINWKAGSNWIRDKSEIAREFNKPFLLSEFGIRNFNKEKVYDEWLKTLSTYSKPNFLVWQYKHKDVYNNDGYGFNETNLNLVHLLISYKNKIINKNDSINFVLEPTLFQNYPNPFNPSTEILFYLPQDEYIQIQIYNMLGEKLSTLKDGWHKKGYDKLLLSFENNLLATGNYIVVLKTKKIIKSIKITLLK